MAGWLEIRRGQAPVTNVNLVGRRVVVGRSPDCDVVLNTTSVSRQHAELIFDDAGWRVRDLGSRNGTGVNGTRVAGERALQSGDVLRIDEFDLVFHAGPAPLRPAARPRTSVTDGAFGPARTLQELGPPKIDASHLSRVLGFSAALLAEAHADQRMLQLCELMTSAHFHGNAAVVLRILRADASAPGDSLEARPAAGGEPPISRSVIKAVLASEAPVLASSARPARARSTWSRCRSCSAARPPPPWLARSAATPSTSTSSTSCSPASTAPPSGWPSPRSRPPMSRQAEDAWSAREAAQRQALLEEELRRAAAIQARLVLGTCPPVHFKSASASPRARASAATTSTPSPTRDGRVLVTVMDVAGKGIDAALIASGLHTTVHLAVRQGMSLPGPGPHPEPPAARHLERRDLRDPRGRARSTPRPARSRPSTAGHPAPMVVSPNGTIRELRLAEGMPIGLLDIDLEISTDRLRPGELLLLYSDGLSECFNGEDKILGVDGLTEIPTASSLGRGRSLGIRSPFPAGCASALQTAVSRKDFRNSAGSRPSLSANRYVQLIWVLSGAVCVWMNSPTRIAGRRYNSGLV